MASKTKIAETLTLLKQTYHLEGQENTNEWALLLEGMTNVQVDAARRYVREHHQSSFVPPMAAFKSWGAAADDRAALNQVWWKTNSPILVRDSKGRDIALCEKGEDRRLRLIFEPREEADGRAHNRSQEIVAMLKSKRPDAPRVVHAIGDALRNVFHVPEKRSREPGED